jgi:sorting nexin-1/2
MEREVAIGSILASSISPNARAMITVSSPELTKNKSHVEYKIHGRDTDGDFEVMRRYRDFLAIRTILVQNWPGCYVPQIPPKQMIVRKI